MLYEAIENSIPQKFDTIEALKNHYHIIDTFSEHVTQSMLVAPIKNTAGKCIAVIEAHNKIANTDEKKFSEYDFNMFTYIISHIERFSQDLSFLSFMQSKIEENCKNIYKYLNTPFLCKDKKMLDKLELCKKVSQAHSPILITGESGSGKQLLAFYIHKHKKNKQYPILIQCSHLVHELQKNKTTEQFEKAIETYFFGECNNREGGIFSLSKNTTLILAEITALPLNIQKIMCSFIYQGTLNQESNAISEQTKPPHIICTTSKDIDILISSRMFLEDLYFLINSINISIPSLSSRPDDIKVIAQYYFDYFIKEYKKPIQSINPGVFNKLKDYGWYYSIVELIHVVERSVLFCKNVILTENQLILEIKTHNNLTTISPDQETIDHIMPLKDATHIFKRNYIIKALKHNTWNCTKTAKILKIQRSYLSRLVSQLKLKKEKQ